MPTPGRPKPMRVAIVGDYPLDPGQIWGGEQAAFAYLVRGLRAIGGVDVHVVTFDRKGTDGGVRRSEGGATVHVIPKLPRLELVRRYPIYRAMLERELRDIRPEVVHAQGAIHHGFVAIRSRYPAVITVHGVQAEDCKHQRGLYLKLRKRFVSWWLERYNLRHTRYLIAISRYVTQYFSRILRPDVAVYHIPNAIDGRFFDLQPPPEGSGILYAGRVIQRKRVLDLVRAFRRVVTRHPRARLRIAGETHSEADYVNSIRRFVREARLEESVKLLGPLDEDRVLEEFASCDCLALPSGQETTPMVIAQAMAAGKPVVATPVGGVADMVRDGETGFLHRVGDAEGLAAALERLFADPALRLRLGEAGKRLAAESYRADAVARRTLEVYEAMLAGEAGGRRP